MVVNVKKHNSLDIDEKQEKCSTVQLDVTNFTSKCVFIVWAPSKNTTTIWRCLDHNLMCLYFLMIFFNVHSWNIFCLSDIFTRLGIKINIL